MPELRPPDSPFFEPSVFLDHAYASDPRKVLHQAGFDVNTFSVADCIRYLLEQREQKEKV